MAAKLKKDERRFVQEFLRLGDAQQAAIAAGLTASLGREFIKREDIRLEIAKESLEKQQINEGAVSTVELYSLWRNIMTDPMVSPGHRLKASELAAKARGMFITKHEVEHSGQVNVNQRRLDVNRLIELMPSDMLRDFLKSLDDERARELLGNQQVIDIDDED